MYHHSFEHAFHYPSIPHVTPIAPAASAAAEAGAAAAAASHATHFRPGPGMMYSHYHPHAFRFRRFGMFRRFFWFGAGAAVATWYYNKQQRIAAANASIAYTGDSSAPAAAGAADRSWSGRHDRWHARHDKQYQQYQQAAQQQQQQAMRVDHQPSPSATVYESPFSNTISSPVPTVTASDNAAPTTPIVPASAITTQVEQTGHNERQWGWRARQRMREHEKQKEREAAAAQVAAAAAAIAAQEKAGATGEGNAAAAIAQVHEQDDMVRIREAVDRLYAEKMREMQSMQERANDKAKEFARDKLDQLSVALETLRQSLKKEEDVKAAQEKKLV